MMTKEEAMELSNEILPNIQLQNEVHLADHPNAPGINVFPDANQFFDPNTYQIHLGAYGPLEMLHIDDPETYCSAMFYFYGHENQHVRSTASRPYTDGVCHAAETVIEYVAKKEGIKKIFRTDRDYDAFVQSELPKHGIYISYKNINDICAFIANAVEDGRIERIRSLEFPGFESQRRYFRGLTWEEGCGELPPYEKLDAGKQLTVILNSILSLATSGLYPKGFVSAYAGTPLIDEVNSLIPYITKGVLAGRTRDMASQVIEIAKMLAPRIYETSKIEGEKMDDVLRQILEEITKDLLTEIANNPSPTSERDEETDDGMPDSVFPYSDLEVTLDDETFDKLKEKMKDSKESQDGIKIKREHPEEETGEGENSGSESSQSSPSNNTGESQSGQSKHSCGTGNGEKEETDEEKSGENSSAAGQKSEQNGTSGKESICDGLFSCETGKEKNGNGDCLGITDDQEQQQRTKERHDTDTEIKEYNDSDRGGKGRGSMSLSEDAIEQATKDAAQSCRDSMTDLVSNINESAQHTANSNRGNAPVHQDLDATITERDVMDICDRGFVEVKRSYKLDQALPPVVAARAKSFRRKNERYFKSLSTPNISHLNSGSVDPSLIYGLAFGETDVFRKIGEDKKFDGCVYMLVDNSGSMRGNKRTEECKAAAVIEEAFKGLIPLKITAFDEVGKIYHEVIKGWEESQRLNCCWNFQQHGRQGYCNEDQYDILVAQKELLARPESKKLLIVLSDGAPASVGATKKAIDETRKKGIKVFGIYFEEGRIGPDADDFQRMYQKDYVCCALDDVDAELTKLMVKFSRS